MKNFIKNLSRLVCLYGATTLATVPAMANADGQNRIVGGKDIDIATAPATVALLRNSWIASTGSYYQAQFCGATVIASRWALTAAHCLVDENGIMPASAISVLIGSTDLEAPVNQPVAVTQIITHQQYSARTQENDIALLRLEYDALVNPVALDNQAVTLNSDAFIAGWGALNMESETQNQVFPSKLQGGWVKMIPADFCESQFDIYSGKVDNRNLCAGVPEGGIDSCQADSGGPLYRYDPDVPGALVLSGVTSWGYGCALAKAPGVYSSVTAFADWISTHTGLSSNGTVSVELEPQLDDTTTVQNPTSDVSPDVNSISASGSLQSRSVAGANGLLWLLGLAGILTLRRIRSHRLT